MTDRFPEAFKRYEKIASLNRRGITNFKELLVSFTIWGGRRAPLTRLQTRALAVEAKKRGVKNVKVAERFMRGKKIVEVNREPQTGRFAPKGETKVIKRTTKPKLVMITDNTRIEKYSGGKTKYRDVKTGKFTFKPKEH